MLHFFLKRFSGCFRIFLYRKFALEEFSEERLAAEDEEDDDHHPDLYLAEHFRVVEVGEPWHEGVGNECHGAEPREEPREVRLQEFSERCLWPASKDEHDEVHPDEEVGDDKQLYEVLAEVVGVVLDAAVGLQPAVPPPAEARAADEAASGEHNELFYHKGSQGGYEELAPRQGTGDHEEHGEENGDFPLEDNAQADDSVGPGRVLAHEFNQNVSNVAHPAHYILWWEGAREYDGFMEILKPFGSKPFDKFRAVSLSKPLRTVELPRTVRMKAVRARGPGGQRVNRRSTKVQLWVKIEHLPLRPAERRLLRKKLKGCVNRRGEICVESESSRSQELNRDAALRKLQAVIERALTRPRRRISTTPPRGAEDQRIREKKFVSERKRARRESF